MGTLLKFNPMTHLMNAYHGLLFHGEVRIGDGLLGTFIVALVALSLGSFVFERLRDTLAEEL